MKTQLRCTAASLGLAFSLSALAQTPRTFTNQYSFGDSLSDSGNIFAATSALGAPNPPAPYFRGRFSNGPVWTEQLGNTLALATTAPASVRSSLNFAFGGAAAGGTNALPPALGLQIGLYQQRGISAARTDLFTVWAGANDLIPALSAPTTPGNPAALDVAGGNAATAVAANVQALIGLGAKNLVVGGMPNLGATPRTLATGGTGVALAVRATNAFNINLLSRLGTIAAAASDVNLVYVDMNGIFNRLVVDFRALGFTNVTLPYLPVGGAPAGTGDPNNYVFWDDIHPTAKTHGLLASIVTEMLNPEIPLGFAGTIGTAALALEGLGTRAVDDRAAQLAASNRKAGQAEAYASFNYGDGDRARDGWRPKFDYRAQVMTGGADLRLASGVFVGGALQAGRLNAELKGGAGDFTVEDATGRLYAVWRGGPVSLLLDADYGVLNVKGIHRATSFGGLPALGKAGGEHWGAGIKLAWNADAGQANLRPWFGLRTQRVTIDPYAEKDIPALAMDFAEQEAKSSSGAVGLDLASQWKLGGRNLRLDLNGAWHGEISTKSRAVSGRLANNFTRSTALSLEDGDGSGVELGGALTLACTKNLSATLGYRADIRSAEKVASRATLSVQTGF